MKQQQNQHHRMPWTKQQDKALINLKENLRLQKWSDIAHKMSQIYNIQHRNHQHCRDRYINFLEHRNDAKKWTTQNYDKLIQFYMQLGNKWSQIANQFSNITGIMIKNKFYSRLRKGIRNVNYLIQTFFQENWEKFNFSIVFKLVNCAANKYDFTPRNIISKRIQQKTFFVEEIIRNVYRLSWMNKISLKKIFNNQKDNIFNRQNISKLIQQINLIDENMDKKHSNRILEKKLSTKKSKRLMQQSEGSVDIKQENINFDFQDKQPLLKVSQSQQNKLKTQLKQIKIQIISTISNQKIIPQIRNPNAINDCSNFQICGPLIIRDIQQNNYQHMSNGKCNKIASYRLIRESMKPMPQKHLFNSQICRKQTNDISFSNEVNLSNMSLINK